MTVDLVVEEFIQKKILVESLKSYFIDELPEKGNIIFDPNVSYPRNYISLNKNFKKVIKKHTADFYVTNLLNFTSHSALVKRANPKTVADTFNTVTINPKYYMGDDPQYYSYLYYTMEMTVMDTLKAMQDMISKNPNVKFITSYNLCKTFNSGEQLDSNKLITIRKMLSGTNNNALNLVVESVLRLDFYKNAIYILALMGFYATRVVLCNRDKWSLLNAWLQQDTPYWENYYVMGEVILEKFPNIDINELEEVKNKLINGYD